MRGFNDDMRRKDFFEIGSKLFAVICFMYGMSGILGHDPCNDPRIVGRIKGNALYFF